MAEERSRLGRGLAALIGDVGDESAAIDRARGQKRVPIEFLRANPKNPRKQFDEEELENLSSSIREKGILQPILVRPVAGRKDSYEIIAGERRWRAAQRAGVHDVPVTLLEINDKEALEIAIVENVQRADLNPLEEAMGYDNLVEQFHYTQNDLAKVVGKSRSHIANTLRLLKLPESVKKYLSEGKLTAGHGRALLSHDDPETLAKAIVDGGGMNVRELEALTPEDRKTAKSKAAAKAKPAKSADIRALEKRLVDQLGMSVAINNRGSKGELKIKYKSLEQLDAVCRKLGISD
ncbi:MAG: ParB/RepB/Spo0J family partition protein [Xanthobacteraceae bacterium]|jgi:ParB family chromosome partitioning protein